MPKTFKIPSVELPYLIGRKLFQMKLKDGFGDKTWADYFIFLTKQGNVKLRSTIDSVIEEGTMDHLLPMWMGNFAENLPYIRDGDVKIKKPKNSRTYTIADLAESTIEIDKHPPKGCYSEDTLVLTNLGWKSHDKAWALKAKILTFNSKNSKLEYQQPFILHSHPYMGKMIHFKNTQIDILVTPNHNMLFRTHGNKKWKNTKAHKLSQSQIDFRCSGEWDGCEVNDIFIPLVKKGSHKNSDNFGTIKMDYWLEFMGYYISEGGLRSPKKKKNYSFGIEQKSSKAAIIDKCLANLPFRFSRYELKNLTYWDFNGKRLWAYLKNNVGTSSKDKHIPHQLLMLSKRQLKILFDALIFGDGYKDPRRGRTSITYHTTSQRLGLDVAELALKLGLSARIETIENPPPVELKGQTILNRHSQFTVHINSSDTHTLTNNHKYHEITEKDYIGNIFCFSVPNGFYVTMRNGYITIQGNSAIVIGRGPSVFNHKHLDILAKSDYKGAICSTDGMLIECLKKHIIPTITVTVDGSPIIKKWFNHPLVKKHGPDIKIILPATVNNEVYQTCVRNKCKVFWYNPMFDIIFRNESFTRIANLMTRTKNTPKGLVTSQAGGNSGSATWIMAMALLKRAPICLIGMDLSYPEGTNLEETPYFSGVTKPVQVKFMYKEIYHPHFKTKALIDAVFWHYRKGFLEMQKSTPAWYRYYGGTINASEGGSIFGPLIKCMSFKSFLDKHHK